jgi:Protein of unknown function (DUF3110)
MFRLLCFLILAGLAKAFMPQLYIPGSTRHRPSATSLFVRKEKKKSDSFDMHELKQRINQVSNPYHDFFAAADWSLEERPEQVHVIWFKPNTDEQGVHTIEYPKGSGNNFVLAFESKVACEKFAESLQAQNFDKPQPMEFELDSLESFCDMLGVFVQVVPEGMQIRPPTRNVQQLGKHNPHLKEEKNHLDYIFEMFDMEVDESGLLTAEEGCWE